jgi:hypothetical protein
MHLHLYLHLHTLPRDCLVAGESAYGAVQINQIYIYRAGAALRTERAPEAEQQALTSRNPLFNRGMENVLTAAKAFELRAMPLPVGSCHASAGWFMPCLCRLVHAMPLPVGSCHASASWFMPAQHLGTTNS